MLRPEDLVELVNCQTEQDLTPTDLPAICTDARGQPAVVPSDEIWILAQSEFTNTASTSQGCTVWITGDGQPPADRWVWVPGITISANSSEVLEPPLSGILRVLRDHDSIWHQGGGVEIVTRILGWRVRRA
ncbi:MAG TPA: hypothetical protein VFH61_18655 [Thermoleophilia bacterium]|nr:hypothetical protein [Thermoleophilia bacterium]